MSKLLCLILFLAFLACQGNKALLVENMAIIPQPEILKPGKGFFQIDANTSIILQGEGPRLQLIADYLNKVLPSNLPIETLPVTDVPDNSIVLRHIEGSELEEKYKLTVTPEHLLIESSGLAGIFYGVQTLKQLMPIQKMDKNTPVGIPVLEIEDNPQFGWRGFMLDVSRHFFEVSDIKQVLDFMAELKLNRFHWHLTDDQGWRVEIKGYPKLTEVGAWRVDYNTTDETISNWWGRPVQQPGDQATYGGFYTQEEIREIVAYAKDRFIEIVPEIDMPGHSQAAIAAYPEISCTGGPFYVATGGVFKDNTYCPGKEITFDFVNNVLNEVMDLFPFEYIHIGGDECNKSSWKLDPDCQKRIADEKLKGEHELQSYFIKRVEKIINNRGRKMIGWDEILEGGLAPNATVMSWRGEKGGIAAARAGHDVIMTPNRYCYLDLKQGPDDLEPNLGYSYSFLKDAYHFKIISDSLTTAQGKHVLGIQGNLWTESISDWSKLTYMTFPRLYAIAENSWTSEHSKDWQDFSNRLLTMFQRLDQKGVRYATSAYNARINHEGKNGIINISMSTEVDSLDIYYTLDGSDPDRNSLFYQGEFTIDTTTIIKATTYKGNLPIGNISEQLFPVHLATGQKVVYHTHYSERYPAAGDQALVDLNYGSLSRSDKAWQGFPGDIELEILFDETVSVQKIELSTLRMTIGGIYPPERIEIWGADQSKDYRRIGEWSQSEISHTQGRNKITISIDLIPGEIQYVKFIAKSVQPIPPGHHLAGSPSWIFLDEVVLY